MKYIVQKWEESERGWGTRPDGYSIHISEADRLKYIRDYESKLPKDVPDEYSRLDGTSYEIELNNEQFQALLDFQPFTPVPGGWRFWKGPYPGSGGTDGWMPQKPEPQKMPVPQRKPKVKEKREAYVAQKGYFIITTSPDGPDISFQSKDDVLKGLNNGDYQDYEFVTRMQDINLDSGEHKVLIIKGETILPAQKEIVTKYEIA